MGDDEVSRVSVPRDSTFDDQISQRKINWKMKNPMIP